MRLHKKLLLIIPVTILLNNFSFPEVIEKIYAVVNDEIITYTELKNFEQVMIASLREEFQGEELTRIIQERRKQLLDRLIDDKLLLSKAKEKNYDVEQYLEDVTKEIMKKNNFTTRDQFKKALASSGIDYENWRKVQKNAIMTQILIKTEIGDRIIVENSEIMEYYRKNIDKYTRPAEFSLNCIFLNKENYFVEKALTDKRNEISAKLNHNGANFEEIAKEYSELPATDNNFFLGDFKKGELNAKIEEAALKLKKGELSPWIETENGWYIIQLIAFTESQLIEYKTVREEIERTINDNKLQAKIKEYVDQLRKDSHIKIYHEYK